MTVECSCRRAELRLGVLLRLVRGQVTILRWCRACDATRHEVEL